MKQIFEGSDISMKTKIKALDVDKNMALFLNLGVN